MVGEDVEHLLSARRKISSSIATLSRLHSSLSSSHSRLQNILRRLSADLPSPPPLHPSAAPELTSLIDAALQSFSPLLLSFQSIHQLQPSLLFDDPQSFLSHYLDIVCCLERHLDLLSQYYSPALDRFQNVVDFLNHTRYLDEYRLRKLTNALVDARNSQPDAGLSRIDGGLLDQALTKLQEEFGRLLALHSSPIDLSLYSSSESDVPISTPQLPISSDLVLKLLVISDRLRVNGRTHKCLQVYREVRARAVRKSIQSLSPVYLQYSTPDAVSRLSWSETEQYLSYWVQHVKVIVTVLFPAERELCGRVFKTVDVSRWLKCFGEIVEQSSFPLFFRFGEAVALSKNPPERLLLPLLNLFDTLENMRQDASNVFESESCLQTWTRFKEFQKQLVHNVCRVFWEFGKRAETQQTVQLPPNGGNDKVVVSYVVNYMIMLVGDYGYLMEDVLRIQQSWKEVGSMQQTNLSLATLRILNSLGKNLDDRARKYSDPALGHVFLMNNYWYMLTRAKSSELGPYVGEGWLKECKSRVDQSALKYKKEGWEKVLVHLSKDGLPVTMSNGRGSGVREFVKARMMAFNGAFEETYYKHCQWSISDVQLREDVKNSVIQLIVPAYHNFVQNYGSVLEGAGGAHRVIKYSASMLEHLLGDLFQDKPGRQLNSISSSETRSSNSFS